MGRCGVSITDSGLGNGTTVPSSSMATVSSVTYPQRPGEEHSRSIAVVLPVPEGAARTWTSPDGAATAPACSSSGTPRRLPIARTTIWVVSCWANSAASSARTYALRPCPSEAS